MAQATEQTVDKTELMLIEIEKNPVVFNKGHKYYKDVTKIKDVWKEIGMKLGLTSK